MTKQPSQLDKFKEAAREAEADMDEKSFDQALGKLAKSEKPERSPRINDKHAKKKSQKS
ncbi:hypothetical protein [Hyphomonas sp. GM-8P]|uniref:hypothetical protein n=1 Tax=Hyphomonas sp. GM-8P TaxID=1280945 RepID=UPI000DC0049B|nr:hypothetical protein [Hyphomonas sp. GM-8P]RAN36783.1 hypothetical protein HY26_07170 [Hyphomonas sp. GM-8P]